MAEEKEDKVIYRKAGKGEAINEGAGLLLKLEEGYRGIMQLQRRSDLLFSYVVIFVQS